MSLTQQHYTSLLPTIIEKINELEALINKLQLDNAPRNSHDKWHTTYNYKKANCQPLERRKQKLKSMNTLTTKVNKPTAMHLCLFYCPHRITSRDKWTHATLTHHQPCEKYSYDTQQVSYEATSPLHTRSSLPTTTTTTCSTSSPTAAATGIHTIYHNNTRARGISSPHQDH